MQEELEKQLKFSKQTVYKSGPKATKILARLLQKQELKHAVLGIRDPSNGGLTHDSIEIPTIFNDYYQTLYLSLALRAENVIIPYLALNQQI